MMSNKTDISIETSKDIVRDPVECAQDAPGLKKSFRTPTKILVAHHDRRVADTVTEILTSAGFHVTTVYECLHALKAAAEFKPDCLISDVVMRQMYGLELGAAIRNMLPSVRVLLLSGLMDNSSILKQGEDMKIDFEILRKPIHPLELIQLLKRER
jgi:PleD family two-component response regulator